jgi:uncharacterized protein YqjF (DUF2071 family)
MAMRWHDLLFAHWRVSVDALRPHVPEGLTIDVFDGSAWLAVVPFRMSGVRARCTPPLPGLGAFPELNLRTYVTRGGEPGVWFFSLDAAQPIAVRTARALFALPYFDARMSCRADGDTIDYSSERTHRGVPSAELRARYRPMGETFAAAAGSLEEFLVERYCLYACDRRGVLRRGRIEHRPWALRRAFCELTHCAMTNLLGFDLRGEPASLLFAHELAVRAELPRRC